MTEQGVDSYGAEFMRKSNDFSVKPLTQDNCVCSICHGTGAKWAIRYVTRNYESARRKKYICKSLQAHEHSLWICPTCMNNMVETTGISVAMPVSKKEANNTNQQYIIRFRDLEKHRALEELPSTQSGHDKWNKMMMYLADLQLTYSPNWGTNDSGDEKIYNFVTELIDELEKW